MQGQILPRTLNRLSARFVQTAVEPGRHADGGGLYLVTTNGGRRWIFLFRWNGKPTEMGLGSARSIPLAAAREMAARARAALARGAHPIIARDAERAENGAAAAPKAAPVTFGQCADELIANLSESWRNPKHVAQWKMTLSEYAKPLRAKPVSEVSTEDVLSVLQPIWRTKAETASRVRGRIERVLSYARAMKYRSGENPALWRGHLDQILPKRERLTRGHHAALPFSGLPRFIGHLRQRNAVAARCLEFTILTAARSGEAFGARWSEIDLDDGLWTIPAERMKAKREHRVPLSKAAVDLLRGMVEHKRGDFVFPTQRAGSNADASLSSMAMEMVLRRMDVGVTVHGFRSTFRDWAAERTSFQNEVCEAALAHTIESRVEAAYRRGDLLEKRRALMEEWAVYCLNDRASIGEQVA